VRAQVWIILAGLVLAGCAGSVKTTRNADVTKGDYYSNEEVKGLSRLQRDVYCASLQSQIDAYHLEAKVFQAKADSVKTLTDSLRTENTKLTTELRDLDNEIRQLRLARRASTVYIVKAGDDLLKISSVVYGTPDRWKEIWEANRDKIAKENSPLTPGLRLTIPSK
jgi:nucleoid-associated protein YgaU